MSFNNIPNRHDSFYLNPNHPKVQYDNNQEFVIFKEDHTIGNILQKQLLTNSDVIFAGYKTPHPLEHDIILRIITKSGDVESAYNKAISELINKLRNIKIHIKKISNFRKSNIIELVDLKLDSMKFIISGYDISIMNSLRRVILAEVPTIAFDKIIINKNDSVLHNEFLQHRLELIPIISHNIENFPDIRDEKCKNCTLDYKLKIKCNQQQLPVFSTNIKKIISDSNIIPYNTDIWIVTLTKGQEIDCDLIARKGIAKEHTKWQAVSIASCYEIDDIPQNIMFYIETIKTLKPEDIIYTAIDVLINKLKDIEM